MNIRLKAIVLIFSGLCSLGSLNGQTPMGVTHSGQSTSQTPFPLTQYTELKIRLQRTRNPGKAFPALVAHGETLTPDIRKR